VPGYRITMTNGSQEPGHDQDAEPPTPDGEEPEFTEHDPDDPTPGSDPDPDPGLG
jgi:hypothetical protein